MKLSDVKKLLDENGYTYTQTIVLSRAEFYRQKGFNPSEDTGAFVAKNDYEGLITAIQRLCERDGKESEKCRKQAEKYNELDRFKEYVKIYLSSLGE